MKKIKNAFFVSVIAVMCVSCASTKNGVGKGFSVDEQVALEKADIAALADASKQKKVTIAEDATVETTDANGEANVTYTDVKVMSSDSEITDATFNRKARKVNGIYNATSNVKGNVKSNL